VRIMGWEKRKFWNAFVYVCEYVSTHNLYSRLRAYVCGCVCVCVCVYVRERDREMSRKSLFGLKNNLNIFKPLFFQVEDNDVVKKQIPASEPGGLEEADFASISKMKELNDEKNINSKDETIPIKASALKCYSSAEDDNAKNEETEKYKVNYGYDATGDESCGTIG